MTRKPPFFEQVRQALGITLVEMARVTGLPVRKCYDICHRYVSVHDYENEWLNLLEFANERAAGALAARSKMNLLLIERNKAQIAEREKVKQ